MTLPSLLQPGPGGNQVPEGLMGATHLAQHDRPLQECLRSDAPRRPWRRSQ